MFRSCAIAGYLAGGMVLYQVEYGAHVASVGMMGGVLSQFGGIGAEA